MTEDKPVLVTDCVMLSKDRHVLLIKRAKMPYIDMWALPGGKVDINESLENACARELKEECGVTIRPDQLKLVGIYSTPGRDPRGSYISATYLCLVGHKLSTKPDSDAIQSEWFDTKNLPKLAFDHNEILGQALSIFE